MVTDRTDLIEEKGRCKCTKDNKSSVRYFVPRLMDMQTAADYLSVSYWTIRGLVQAGRLETVEFPRPEDNEPIRRVLIDRTSLDQFVDDLRRHKRPD